MKKLIYIFFIVVVFVPLAESSSINSSVYKTMSAQSYRTNYRSNINNGIIPYWKVQSNYSTRNKVYGNYSQYNNAVERYKSSHQIHRGY